MCEVYSKSALTISVPICTESSQSFLAERRKGFREQSQLAAITHKEGESRFKSRSWFRKGHLSRRDGPWFLEDSWKNFAADSNHPENRWLDRGWTLQEWILSPRVLHIDSMTLWDCFDGYANEMNHRHMGKPFLVRNPTQFSAGISWDFLVREYSKRKVTREADRLPALAGLAARYARETGHTYLAGLWREDLPRSFVWKGLGSANGCAPSWSWASLNGKVSFPEIPGDFIAKVSISSFFCQYNPPGSFTAVEKAWIDVDGHVVVVMEQSEDTFWDAEQREYDSTDHKVNAGDGWWWDVLDHGGRHVDDAIAKASVYLLLLGSTTRHGHSKHYALVLQECGWEDNRPCFRRLSLANLWHPEWDAPPKFGSPWEARMIRLV